MSNVVLTLTNLATEEPDSNHATRSAVDVAMSLSKDFGQVPEDVDLSAFIQEPIAERQPSPVKLPSPVRQPSPQKVLPVMKQPVIKEFSLVKQPCVKEPSLVQEPCVKEPSPVKEPVIIEPSPVRQPTIKEPGAVDEPCVKEPSPVKQPAVEHVAEKSLPQRRKGKRQPVTEPENKPSTQSKDKGSTQFDFGLPKKSSKITNKPNESDMSKVKTSSTPLDVKDILNVNVDDSSTQDEDNKGPTVDLDAPEEKSKPVLLVTETEAENLEDWLDSMLDD